jgi:porin
MLDAEYGLPLANGATGIQTNEAVLEVNYDFHVLPGLSVEPDFQYVIRPNAQSNIGNAAVFGFKSHISF